MNKLITILAQSLFILTFANVVVAGPPPIPATITQPGTGQATTNVTGDLILVLNPDAIGTNSISKWEPSTDLSNWVTNGPNLVPPNYKELTSYFTKPLSGSYTPPSGLTNKWWYTPNCPYRMKIVGTENPVTNYYPIITIARGYNPPPPVPKPEKVMSFKMTLYDDLTRKPMGVVDAEVNWDTGFMKSEMVPITNSVKTVVQ